MLGRKTALYLKSILFILILNINFIGFASVQSYKMIRPRQAKSLLGIRCLSDFDQKFDCNINIQERMKLYKTSAVGIAIIDKCKVAWARSYGSLHLGQESPLVDTSTVFQAASMSKAVAAVGALALVEQGKLSLDDDINKFLTSWKVPDNDFTKTKKVTLRGLASHTSGLSLRNVGEYSQDADLPTIVDILEGKKPQAKTDPVRVIFVPGQNLYYSGGGSTVMQLAMQDVTGENFESWMTNNILNPSGMKSSSFDQPDHQNIAHGYYKDGTKIVGNWYAHPAKAAAGLWSTPTDMAQIAITLLHILHNKRDGYISQALLSQALTVQYKNTCGSYHPGLGFFIDESGFYKIIGHDGCHPGCMTRLRFFPEREKGLVVMINNSDSRGLMNEIDSALAQSLGIFNGDNKSNISHLD